MSTEPQEEQSPGSVVYERDYDLFTTEIPEDVDPRIHIAMIAYNAVKMAVGEWKLQFQRFKKSTKTDNFTAAKFHIETANFIVDMCKKAQENFRLADNFEDMKKQIQTLRSDIGLMKNVRPEEYQKLVNELDRAEKKVDRMEVAPLQS